MTIYPYKLRDTWVFEVGRCSQPVPETLAPCFAGFDAVAVVAPHSLRISAVWVLQRDPRWTVRLSHAFYRALDLAGRHGLPIAAAFEHKREGRHVFLLGSTDGREQ